MKIRPFQVEIWMNDYENNCDYNLAETCVRSLTVAELLDMAGAGDSILEELRSLKLTYGPIQGSGRLRGTIAGLYERVDPGDVVITHGAIGANALVYQAMVEAGDRVVSIVPSYQQHTSIPESIGADVIKVPLRYEADFQLDLDELRTHVGTETKLISLTNPNNPTGALLGRSDLQAVVDIAAEAGAHVLCDEVYRGTDQSGPGSSPSICDLYDRGISTGSMSKAFALAGLRLGWIAGPTAVIEAVSVHRDFNTISVGMVDDLLASIALESSDAILERSRSIVRRNGAILDDWVRSQPTIDYVKPQSGTITMLRYHADLPSRDFCIRLLDETGVLLAPGSAFDMEGYVRIGYANDTEILEEGLTRLGKFLQQLS